MSPRLGDATPKLSFFKRQALPPMIASGLLILWAMPLAISLREANFDEPMISVL